MKLNELYWMLVTNHNSMTHQSSDVFGSIDHIVPVDAVEVVECQSQ